MLTIKKYQQKLFSTLTLAMIAISFVVMVFGYFASKNSTISKIQQSAALEIKLKKEILSQLLDQSEKIAQTLKTMGIYDELYYAQKLHFQSENFLSYLFSMNPEIIQLRYVDKNNDVLGHFYKDEKGKFKKNYDHRSLGKYIVNGFQTLVAYKTYILDLKTKGEKTILTSVVAIGSEQSILGYFVLELDISSWIPTLLDSELFEIAYLDDVQNTIRHTQGVQKDKAYFLHFIQRVKEENNDWIDGYMHKSSMFLHTLQRPIYIHLQSKPNLSEITIGMGKIFILTSIPIVLFSFFISYFLTKGQIALVKQIIAREDLLLQESKMLEIGGMMSYLAHQWKQPINKVATSLMNITKELKASKNTKLLQSTQEAEILMQEMGADIENFRNFYRFSKEKSLFNIYATFKEIEKIVAYQLDLHQIDISYSGDEELNIYGYKNDWMHAILSILNNIIEAYISNDQKENRHIHVQIGYEEDYIIIRIKDFAGGISQEMQKILFEKYSSDKENFKSTGIGLYFAKVILEKRYRGYIDFTSNTQGTTFVIKHLNS